jgi:hypothetical protein
MHTARVSVFSYCHASEMKMTMFSYEILGCKPLSREVHEIGLCSYLTDGVLAACPNFYETVNHFYALAPLTAAHMIQSFTE